jgi:hypothetical protein
LLGVAVAPSDGVIRRAAERRRLQREQTRKNGLLTGLLTDCLLKARRQANLFSKNSLVGEEGLEPSKS